MTNAEWLAQLKAGDEVMVDANDRVWSSTVAGVTAETVRCERHAFDRTTGEDLCEGAWIYQPSERLRLLERLCDQRDKLDVAMHGLNVNRPTASATEFDLERALAMMVQAEGMLCGVRELTTWREP